MGEKFKIVAKPINILVTDEDKRGNDVTKMSDFFGLYIQDLSYGLATTQGMRVVENISVADLEIINEVVQHADAVLHAGTEFIPDFDSLSNDIQTKLKKGIYKLGESRQVDGNMRAVIVDENNVRVKDITLKEVVKTADTLDVTRSIANQMQMRQIYVKLVDIQEMQNYQIDRDRDRDIIIPFLNARDYILKAQNCESIEERKITLNKATDYLNTSVNAIYTDMSTTVKYLLDKISWPIFRKRKQINAFMDYLTQDLQFLTKFVGLQMQLYDCLGQPKDATDALDKYQHIMTEFISDSNNKYGKSAAMLMHLNYPYIEDNRDCWYKFQTELSMAFEQRKAALEEQKVFVISMEDIENGRE